MKIISPKRLEALRKEFGFTQQEVSRLLGCDESYYSTIKNGYRKGSKKFYEGICKIYDTTIAREALIELGYTYSTEKSKPNFDVYVLFPFELYICRHYFKKYSVNGAACDVFYETIDLIKDRMEEMRNE